MTSAIIDLTGRQFGRWTVLALHPERHRYRNVIFVLWLCRCDCGTERTVLGNSLRRGKSISCGCIQREKLTERLLKHGHSRSRHESRIYQCWKHMLQRCCNSRCKDYPYYGGRGISVCARWQTFENFLADMGEPSSGKMIDRIDANGNYEPGNCRWATRAEQTANRRPLQIRKTWGAS